jgi:hypothetical protein
MRAKVKAGGHDSPYRLRKQLPEPVFGQIKKAGGFASSCCAASKMCVPWSAPRRSAASAKAAAPA